MRYAVHPPGQGAGRIASYYRQRLLIARAKARGHFGSEQFSDLCGLIRVIEMVTDGAGRLFKRLIAGHDGLHD